MDKPIINCGCGGRAEVLIDDMRMLEWVECCSCGTRTRDFSVRGRAVDVWNLVMKKIV